MDVTGEFGIATIIGLLPQTGDKDAALVIVEALANPSLSYVPIYASSVVVTREATISTSMIMSQAAGNKQFVTDNTAPMPRVWTVTGYLRSLLPYIEGTLYFKPTILLQKFVLDYALTSRNTVPFKTADGEMVDVLVKTLKMTSNPQNQSSVQIDVTVQEMVYLTAEEGTLASLSDSAKASIAPVSIASIGVAVAASATVAGAVGIASFIN
jgi:hypothetical protein